MIVVIKPCPLLFVFFCSCGECCPPNNAFSDKAGTPSVLLNELQKQCGHNSYSLGSHNLWLCCLFFCHLSICFTLEQIDFHINSKFSQRTNRRESFFRLNASNNFPPGPLMLVTQPPVARSCHNCRWRGLCWLQRPPHWGGKADKSGAILLSHRVFRRAVITHCWQTNSSVGNCRDGLCWNVGRSRNSCI